MNDIIVDRVKSYRAKTPEQEKDALREIIQEITLLGLWRAKFFEHAAFYGGTALRILYGLDRFSEDLDFTLLRSDARFKLASYCSGVREELAAYGFEANVETKAKKTQTSTESAFVKADTLVHLIKIGSPFRATKGELLQVKFEVDTSPALGFATEVKQFFWPQAFTVTTFDLPSLFAGKLHATFCRDRITNVKGRDFYDLLWYVGRGVKPNLAYLEAKLRESGHLLRQEAFTAPAFRSWALARLEKLDIDAAKSDLQRFLPDQRSLEAWSPELFKAAIERITT
ncbi:MAG: nucleotidyl transferase AbiEii/AbiGii toxin family protein [Deltaproteobacteria bacterium]|nr:nucleotidyl transferase AbiEii/AbiGii toxin family protein [Deltaproteobacteria bacterium]